MPKGRGSGVRRLKRRQRAARIVNRLPSDHPLAIRWEERRRRHMEGKAPKQEDTNDTPRLAT